MTGGEQQPFQNGRDAYQDLLRLQEIFEGLIPHSGNRASKEIVYRLPLRSFPRGREFAWAELRLPHGFPEYKRAKIVLSPDAVLRIPHVEVDGSLCIEGDPGPSYGYSAADRVQLLLNAYETQFLAPWLAGEIDADFEKEPLNYWVIEVARAMSNRDPVRTIWTLDKCPSKPIVREGILLQPSRLVIAAEGNLPITNRVIQSLGEKASQRIRVLIADIPITHTYAPSTWPKDKTELSHLLKGRLPPEQLEDFWRPLRLRRQPTHRIVLLRNSSFGFAYLLPGGPPTVVAQGIQKRSFPPLTRPLPLIVKRLDPSWTVGRDQHTEVNQRQVKHVLILGAGALGSPVAEYLTKAGIGMITLVDDDVFTPPNLGRHLLGTEYIGQDKANAVAKQINLAHPSSVVIPRVMTAQDWFNKNSLHDVDLILDLTGEPDVRWHVEQARQKHLCPLLIGWMEPYVAAAHACLLPAEAPWMQEYHDPMHDLEAITWPDEVIRQEPGCSSLFQSYTASAAAYAVALVAENALNTIDYPTQRAKVFSWVRGQRFLDKHMSGLVLREWAQQAAPHEGLVIERPFP